MAWFEPLGIGPGRVPSRDSDHVETLAAAVNPTIEYLRGTFFFFEKVNGWKVSRKLTSYTFDDPLLRASLNFLGPAFHLVPEALYFNTVKDVNGNALAAERKYKLVFPKGQVPPVDAFWSVIMYSGVFQLVPNAINRYAVNSYTSGVQYGDDGSLALLIQRDQPDQGTSNWLPAPQKGPFMIFIRCYQPREEMRNFPYELPMLQAA